MKIMKGGTCGLALFGILGLGWVLMGGKTNFPELTAVAFQQENAVPGEASAEDSSRPSVFLNRRPLRVLRDTYPTYSAVAVDVKYDEVYLQDESLIGLMVFDRLANTPPTATMTEPKRIIGGNKTNINYNCALYVDPESGDVYTVNNDMTKLMTIWPRGAEGNIAPPRMVNTPFNSYGIAVDEEAQELFLTTQYPAAVMVYRKMVSTTEAPLRILEGLSTGLADPHGVVVDTKNQLMFVNNHGAVSFAKDGDYFTRALPDILKRGGKQDPLSPIKWDMPPGSGNMGLVKGSGRFEPPSINVYPLKAKGNTPPLRVITGPKTQLNWPSLMALDQEQDELFVANDTGDSILVFSTTTSSGNIEPKRVLKGPKTGIKNPTGVSVDLKNRELWVANMGNHTATVYSLSANGNTAPLRTIRSAPLGQPAMMIGNPGSVGFDTKRDEILVPN